MTEEVVIRRSNNVVQKEVSFYNSMYKNSEECNKRKDQYGDLVSNYYNISTDFYEYGWGQSFHFANRYHGETLVESLHRHELYLALKLQLKPGDKVLDLGCGIGGPLRRIAHLTSAHITGITICSYQIHRANKIGVPNNCQFIQGDFMKLPFEDNTFDHVYTIEAVCHAPDKSKCFAEVSRVLKPGGSFVGYDWCLTDKYDSENPIHIKAKQLIEHGDGLPELKTTKQTVSDLKAVDFMVEESFIIPEGDIPWYQPLKGGDSYLSLTNFRLTNVGRWLTRTTLWLLESFRFAAQGSLETLSILETAREGLLRGGESEIFTPYLFFLARKRLQ